ncbi:hypothetical protein AN958_04474 [Leucoagaricus sp. SymC.cos]|nr:hypothetical protein AN958_04474 [Leucoagaricus sp. SymC.cos]
MLADFGLSRIAMTLPTTVHNAGYGTVYWMAPEQLLMKFQLKSAISAHLVIYAMR